VNEAVAGVGVFDLVGTTPAEFLIVLAFLIFIASLHTEREKFDYKPYNCKPTYLNS
jgi:hypothetical protein